MSKIIFSIGHHDNDPGAVANGTTEHFEVKKIVHDAAGILQRIGTPFLIIPTSLNLQQKISWVNQNASQNDFLFAVHMNASSNQSATGITTFFQAEDSRAKDFASTLQGKLVEILKLQNRGVKKDTKNRHGRLGIIRDTLPRAWLFELGFVSNLGDLTLVRTGGALALASAVLKSFSLQNPFLPKQNAWVFSDVNLEDWFFPLVMDAKNSGLMRGFSDGTFRPKESLSRAEFLSILRQLGLF